MKQRNLFKDIFLVGVVFVLFLISSCGSTTNNTPGNPSASTAKEITITKVTIKDREYNVSTSQDIILPKGIESFETINVKKVKGKIGGTGPEIDLTFDKIEPTPVNATDEGTPFNLFTKATKNYKAGKIELKAFKAKDVTVTYEVEKLEDNQPHGTISVLKAGAPVDNNTPVQTGDTLTVTATPDGEYVVAEWKVNDVVRQGEKSNVLRVAVENAHVASGLKITVKFKSTNVTVKYEVENSADGKKHGTISGLDRSKTPPVLKSGDKVKVGVSLTFAAEPENASYEVEEWKVNGEVMADKKGTYFTIKPTNAHIDTGLNVTVKFKAK